MYSSNFKDIKSSVLILTILLIVTFFIALFIGSWNIPPSDIWSIIAGNGSSIASNKHIAINVRIIRIILAILAGSILSISGVITQACFRNPLADPYLLGISSGSAVGAAIAIIFSSNIIVAKISTFLPPIFAISSVLLLLYISYRNNSSTSTILLLGIIVNAIFNACLSILKMIAEIGQLREIVFWQMGSLSYSNWNDIICLTIISFIFFIIIFILAPRIDLITIGDSHAIEQGINPLLTRCLLLVITAILIGLLIRITGIIGGIGLIVPHIVRIFFRRNVAREIITLSALTGGLLLLIADTITRTISKLPLLKQRVLGEIPISITASILSAILLMFVFIINKFRKEDLY